MQNRYYFSKSYRQNYNRNNYVIYELYPDRNQYIVVIGDAVYLWTKGPNCGAYYETYLPTGNNEASYFQNCVAATRTRKLNDIFTFGSISNIKKFQIWQSYKYYVLFANDNKAFVYNYKDEAKSF